jgi:hypothetical protein
LVELIGLPAPVGGLVFTAGFKFCAAWFPRFPVVPGCADAIAYAVALPRGSVMQEMLITPLAETSWP